MSNQVTNNFKTTLSVIVTAHHEGRLAHHTMKSIFRALQYATSKSEFTYEIIIILDNPDQPTLDYFARYQNDSNFKIVTTTFGDSGAARNAGVDNSESEYVVFVDGDDLISKEWLYKALTHIRKYKKEIVVHPQYTINFGELDLIWKKIPSTDPRFDIRRMLEFTYWDPMVLAKRSTLKKVPFQITRTGEGFGMEDWHWNCEVLAEEIEHHVIPHSIAFMRRKKSGSRLTEHLTGNTVIPRSKLFEPRLFSKLIKENIKESEEQVIVSENTSTEPATTTNYEVPIAPKVEGNLGYRIIRFFYKYIRKVIRPIVKANPRVHLFFWKLKIKAKAWLKPKPIQQTEEIVFPEPIPALNPDTSQSVQHAHLKFPEWLLDEWKEMNRIEPMLFPTSEILERIIKYDIPHSHLADYYLKIFSEIGYENVSDLIFVPWLKAGGADLEVINNVKGLLNLDDTKKIVVIATNDADSPWADRLPRGVKFIELHKLIPGLSAQEYIAIFMRIILQLRPKRIHTINSFLFNQIIQRNIKAIASASDIYFYTFCDEYTPEGKCAGYSFDLLPDHIDYIKKIIVDNQAFINKLVDTYAFDPNKFIANYHPMELHARPKHISKDQETINILWAGRLDRQKRPDLLIKIIEKAERLKLPFHFHVYGSALLDNYFSTDEFARFSNATYQGSFTKGIPGLEIDKFDLFLNTSEYDGMPNVVLESASCGLPIISSDVGGISEFLEDKNNAILINPFDDVNQYIEALKFVDKNRDKMYEFAVNAQLKLKKQHDWPVFFEKYARIFK